MSEGRVTSPPCRRERQGRAAGMGGWPQGAAQGAGSSLRHWGGGTGSDTYPEEGLELRAVVERRDVHSEAKQVLGPLPPLFNH